MGASLGAPPDRLWSNCRSIENLPRLNFGVDFHCVAVTVQPFAMSFDPHLTLQAKLGGNLATLCL